MKNRVATFIILSIICGLLSFHAQFNDYIIWVYILTITQYVSLVCALYYSGVIKFKGIIHGKNKITERNKTNY